MDILGILGNVLAAPIVFALGLYWSRIIIPWHEGRVYQGVRIDTTRWESESFANGERRVGLWKLQQRAHRIEGTISMIDGPTRGTEYGFKGEFKNNLLSGTFYRKGANEVGRGLVLLQLRENGNRLVGYTIFYNPQTEAVGYSENLLLARDKSIV